MNQRDKATHELISAYLDGELSADERARAEQLLRSDHEHQQVLEDMQALATDMGELPAFRLDEQFAHRVVATARSADPSLLTSKLSPSHYVGGSGRLWRTATLAIVATAAAVLLAFVMRENLFTGTSGGNRLAKTSPAEVAGPDSATAAADTVDPTTAAKPQPVVDPAGSGDVTASDAAVADSGTADDSGAGTSSSAMVTANDPPSPKSDPSVAQGTGTGSPQERATQADVPAGKPRIEMGPGRISQKILLVIDVQLTKRGSGAGQFERLLREEGVAFDTSIKVEAGLEQTLLDSRFFEPLGEDQDDRPPFTVVYVVARGGAIDRTWTRMQEDPTSFSRVSLDIALHPNDITIFGRLHQLGDVAALQARNPDQNGVALPLELSPGWNGVPVERTEDGGGLGQILSSETPPGRRRETTPQEEADRPYSGHMTEAIFVLHGTSD